eukprot:618597-Hanusia_phi.AAC.1
MLVALGGQRLCGNQVGGVITPTPMTGNKSERRGYQPGKTRFPGPSISRTNFGPRVLYERGPLGGTVNVK